MNRVTLREMQERDLPIFFEHQKDPISNKMAAFTAKDPTDWNLFYNHWYGTLTDGTIIKRTIMLENDVVGHVLSFEMFGELEVSYWIDRTYWGKGIATEALKQFLSLVTIRPIYARAAKDNIGSIRVLEKCGFVITDEGKGFANARNKEIEEFIFIRR
ncbi:Protein N-acetyltransferase, RimJ/RimL family [Oceanobacillus limi]|uniref:Protein N-acetyltransferase, RimJ/RimL family n=1 Tax=Oceanobacillus limi TaxID=930131 RepID=A0A1I0G2L2_9BACI|nr:GNAT family N-acetyltransferase [Oceanobacillus limi]SET64822.1 Protein N-acetyltransferase, RimJ/RimL family [Oceanobacillus limi]